MRLGRNWTVAIVLVGVGGPAAGAFEIQYTIANPGAFTAAQLSVLDEALARSKAMWETVLTGYRPGISVTTVPITVNAMDSGLAEANYSGAVVQGGYRVSTAGYINVNRNEILNFANWQGYGANGLNFIDELMAHETGHVLGVGTQWVHNGVYVNHTYQYTGAHGLAAYRAEFDPAATFVPVENAGQVGTINAHWDQRMRSSVQEGNPSDPWPLDPRVGVVDAYGRDRGLDLMSGAIDPDWREPFLSRTTVESMRDLGFTVASFYDFNGDGAEDGADLAILTGSLGMTGLQIDSIRFGDVDRDRDVDGVDLSLWTAAVPEPRGVMACGALLVARGRRRGR